MTAESVTKKHDNRLHDMLTIDNIILEKREAYTTYTTPTPNTNT